jgi:Lar family restriction alleviation protein
MRLESCPFCQSDDIRIFDFGEGRANNFHAHCSECLADGPIRPTRHEASEAWNTRAPERKRGDGHPA